MSRQTSWNKKYGDVDAYEGDTKPEPSEWSGAHPTDSNGNEYNPYAGSQTPAKGRCNAILTNSYERYEEARYCMALPYYVFTSESEETAKPEHKFCRKHKQRKHLMDNASELYKHGAFTENYINLWEHVDGTKKLLVIDLFKDLLSESKYNFDLEYVEHTVDVEDIGFLTDDEVPLEFPVPNDRKLRANALWFAALDFVRLKDMQEIVVNDGPEKWTTVDSADVDGSITDTIEEKAEHHLNLPISRLTKDYQRHLEVGGVITDDDGSDVTVEQNEYVLDYGPNGNQQESDVPLTEER